MKIKSYTDKRRKNADGSYSIYLQVTIDSKRFLISTGMKTFAALHDFVFPESEPNAQSKSNSLYKKVEECLDFHRLHPDIRGEELKWNLTQLINSSYVSFHERTMAFYFDKFLFCRANELDKETIKLYGQTKNTIIEFDEKATLSSITADWLARYYNHRIKLGRKINGISRNLRDIRTVFNWCRKKHYTENYPFADYTIKQERTRHRNLNVDTLRRLIDMPIALYQERYRDIFFLSLYLWGINIGDLLCMKREDYYDGYIHYTRNKTNKPYCIKVEPEAAAILEKYKGEDHLLCFMDTMLDYHSFLKQMNKALKSIGKNYQEGKKTTGDALFPFLSSMYARHTIASLAAEIGHPMSTISMGLGHSMTGGALVTQVYVEFQQWIVDDCMRDIIDYLQSGLPAKQYVTQKRIKESGMGDILNSLSKIIGQ